MNDSPTSKQRNPAIELYRIMLMFLIVLHHAAAHGCWANDIAYLSIPLLFTVPTLWHVDGFLSITGWFGTSFTLTRYIKIWGVLMFYTLIDFAYNLIANSGIYLHTAGGWFAKVYLFFLCLTPLLNASLSFMRTIEKKKLYVVWILLNVALTLDWLPTHLFSCIVSGQGGMSLLTFVAIYLNVGLLHISGLLEKVKKAHILYCSIICVIGILVFSIIPATIALVRGDVVHHLAWIGFSSYNAPHIYLFAIVLLVFFAKFVRVASWFSTIILQISPFMFGIYVLHCTTSFGKMFYVVPQSFMVSRIPAMHPAIIVFISAFCCFIGCLIVEQFRCVICNCVAEKILRFTHRFDKHYFSRGGI